MKINKLTAVIMLSLGAGSLLSHGVMAAEGELLVWEDIKKSNGIEDAIKAFEAQYKVKVKIQEMPYAQQIEKLRLDGPAGIGPDVLVIPHDQVGGAVVQGLLSELKVDAKYMDSFTKPAVDAQTYEGKLYGIPKAVETIVLVYNKDILPKAPETFDDLIKVSKEQRAANKYGLLAKFDEIYYSYGVVAGMGGYIFGQNANGSLNVNDIGLANQGTIDAVTFLKSFYADGLFPAGIVGETGANAIDSLFTEKKAAAVITGPWAFKPYQDAGVNYGVAPLPTLPNGEHMRSFLGVKGYSVSTYSTQKELAQQFIEFINQPEYAKIRFEKTGEIPPVKSLIDDPVIKGDEKARAVAIQAGYAVPMPSVPEMQEVWTPSNSALQLSVTGKQDVKAALNGAVKTINMQIEANHANRD
ncbi:MULTISPECIES: extracellular solute-binding protein [Aeromonas]|uniref:extracellular solute-binding protein n=1 Tax=Aeromonas TaxID=642 RepID=UPI00030C24A6|nr:MULTISPECIES: extracellular solute-binding protein [Aeromonas]EKP0277631.1 extracellular solute-binding protein [Aeromonas bestiarum]KTA82982.1 cyclodextrin-binding protein [Aeromonas salmonicida]MCE9933565.1 extracellular solute-binding protein [Aeromonas salmonicida]MDF2402731.1 extracellular solute-binding protein [Aeromonas sp. 5HA1]MDM5101789.1 extracellular solute-binding protein [Aeromonas salmonicida]